MASANGYTANGHAPPVAATSADRLPPQNLEAERGVLGSILLDNSCLPSVVEALPSPDAFFRDAHQTLYRAILDLHARGMAVDAITLAEELLRRDEIEEVGGVEFLAEVVAAVPHSANARYYADIVRQKATARCVIAAANEILSEGYSNSRTAEELLEIAGTRIARAETESGREPEGVNLRPWPDPPGEAVWYGLAGDIVRLIAPHTEADRVAILGQFLVGFGSIVGRAPHWRVESTRHGTNLFMAVVGNSSKARKGTSWDNVRWILNRCDEVWARDHVMNGLSSGEGLIWSVRDPISKSVKVGGDPRLGGGGYEEREIDPGVSDKRMLWVESEFGATLSVLSRDGNNLNGVLRQAWDGIVLGTATKNSPARATDSHVSVIAHITCDELSRRLTHNDAGNGFANRFLWVCAQRSQYLPHGGRIFEVDFRETIARCQDAVCFARDELSDGIPLIRDAAANRLWEQAYPTLSEPKPGLLGSVTSRAEAQVMRLAAVYALLDTSKYVRAEHLAAGLEFWRYCEQSAAYIFGDAMGDADAERLLAAIREAGDAGLTLTKIRQKVFGGRMPAEQYGAKLTALSRAGLVRQSDNPAGGRGRVWVATRNG